MERERKRYSEKKTSMESPERKMVRLGARLLDELFDENGDPLLLDGMQRAIEHYPNLYTSLSGISDAESLVETILDGNPNSLRAIEKLSLDDEDIQMFRSCSEGISEENSENLKKFFGIDD